MPFGDALLGARVVLLNAANRSAPDTEDHTEEEEANNELGLYIALLGLAAIALVLLGPLLWAQTNWGYADEPYAVVVQPVPQQPQQPQPVVAQAQPVVVQGELLPSPSPPVARAEPVYPSFDKLSR